MSIIKESTILEEIRSLKEMLERIEALLEERLIGIEEPLPDEIEAIETYEEDKKKGRIELLKLENILSGD